MTILAAGCATAPSARSSPEGADCGPAIPNIDQALKPEVLLLLGEMHGTSEIPRFVGQLACQISSRHGVRVGLEIPTEEQARVDRFLGSPGEPVDHRALLAGPFWTREYQDGRSSQAMAALFEELRKLKRSGLPVEVFLFDSGGVPPARDAAMATNILDQRRDHAKDVFLILSGNLHVRTVKGTPWDADFVPMGWHLVQAGKSVVSLNNAYSGGATWACTGQSTDSCGAHPQKGKDRSLSSPSIEMTQGSEGYDGIFYVGAITASVPAVQQKKNGEPAADAPKN